MIGKLKGIVDAYGEDFVILDVHGRRLRGPLLLPHPAEPAARRRGGGALHRDPCARGHDPPVRLPLRCGARMVPAASERAGRRRQGGARHPLGARSRQRSPPPSPPATRPPSPAAPASARSSPSASSPNSRTRRRPSRPSTRPSSASPARVEDRTAPRAGARTPSRRWSISAIRRSQASAAVAAAMKQAGEEAGGEDADPARACGSLAR